MMQLKLTVIEGIYEFWGVRDLFLKFKEQFFICRFNDPHQIGFGLTASV